MIKTHEESCTETHVVVDDIVCNRCGCTCKDDAGMNYEGLIEAHVCGGYASVLGDGRAYVFSLCERCLQMLFAEFKHDPYRTPKI